MASSDATTMTAVTPVANETFPETTTYTSTVIKIEGKNYEPVKEGLATILKPIQDGPKHLKARGSGFEQQASVFYNPIQQFNRDLSVLAIKVFADHHLALAQQQSARHGRKKKARGKKRKREEEEEEEADGPDEAGTASNGGGEPGETASKKPRAEDANQSNHAEQGVDGELATAVPLAENAGDQQQSLPSAPPRKVNFQILDALSATGLRALRYAKEIPAATRIVSNDLSALAVDAIKKNIKYNEVEDIVRPNVGDARAYMYSLQSETDAHNRKFHVIDLDPYGTAGPFLDAAVQAVTDGGMLCITCTDAAVFASTGYPEKTYSLYGGIPVRLPHGHEVGLRLLIHAVASAGAKYGLAIEPLLSLSIDYYARIFVRVHKSPVQVKCLSSNTMLVYSCDSGCGAWTTQYLTSVKIKQGKNDGQIVRNYGLAQAPTAPQFCEHCGFKTHLAGPMWGGPLHNPHFIQRILDIVPESDPEIYQTLHRIEGMLTTALEEDLDLSGPVEGDPNQHKKDEVDSTTRATATTTATAIIPRLSPHLREKYPFFVSLSALCKVLHTETIPINAFRGALHGLGYRTTRSHTRPNTVRTDAPWDVLWEIMREWARQRSEPGSSPSSSSAAAPVAVEQRYKLGTAAAGIMKKDRSVLEQQSAVNALRKEIELALRDGKDVADLTVRIEAALYRKGSSAAAPVVSGKVPIQAEATAEAAAAVGNGNKKEEENRPHPSTMTIKFDEELGKRFSTEVGRDKKVVRYPMNPDLNWGPMSRASGH